MDLASTCNAPRELCLGGVTYRARTLTLNHLGEVLAWLEGRVRPEDEPFRFGSEASRLALASTDGLAVVLHLSLLSCHPNLSRDAARALAAGMDVEDEAALLGIAFRRRPMPRGADDEDARGGARDLAEIDWGPIWESLSGHVAASYQGCGDLTLDQFDCWASKGEVEGPDSLTPAQVQAMYDAAPGGGGAPPAAPSPDAILLPGESIAAPAGTGEDP